MKTQGGLARIISTLSFIDGVTRVCPYLLCIMDKKRFRKWKDHLVSTTKKLGLGLMIGKVYKRKKDHGYAIKWFKKSMAMWNRNG